MKITEFNPNPIVEFDFLNAGRRPNQFYVDKLPVHVGKVDRLPVGVDALVVTADLQGREAFPDRRHSDQLRLLGEVLPQMLRPTLAGIGVSSDANVGAILADAMCLSQRDIYCPARHEMPGCGFDKSIVPKARQIERSCATVKMCRAFGTVYRRSQLVPAFHAGLGNKTCLWHYIYSEV